MATLDRGQERRSHLRQGLVDAQGTLAAVLERLGPSDWSRRSPNEGWTIRELLAHLSTAERGFVSVIRRLAAGEGGVPDDFDRDRWNASQLRKQAEVDERGLWQQLVAAHEQLLDLLERMDDDAFERRGRLSSGEDGSVEDAFRLIARHMRDHTTDVEAALAPA